MRLNGRTVGSSPTRGGIWAIVPSKEDKMNKVVAILVVVIIGIGIMVAIWATQPEVNEETLDRMIQELREENERIGKENEASRDGGEIRARNFHPLWKEGDAEPQVDDGQCRHRHHRDDGCRRPT